MKKIGKKLWVIPEGYIPPKSNGPKPEMESHETLSILNTFLDPAEVEVYIYFEEIGPIGPYILTVPPERTRHFRFNDFKEPAEIPRGVNFASVIQSDVPIVVQYTRLDSRQSENAIFSTIAYS